MSLELTNLGRHVDGRWILRQLSLSVEEGECLALVGPSGCGKSTTLRLIAGLDQPTEGRIVLDGVDVTRTPPIDRKVGMVFQSYALFPHLSVGANLELGLKVRGISPADRLKRVQEVLQLVQLEDQVTKKPGLLSGGQRQRVALARALLRDPLVYLLDEPMSNLDAQLREDLRPQLRRLVLRDRKPVVYVTHDQHEAMAMADRIAVLNKGRIEQVASPKQLYQKPQTLFVAQFIGRPQINVLPVSEGVIRAIRPECLAITPQGLRCRVQHREWLGSSQILTLESDLGLLRMLTSAEQTVSEVLSVGWAQQDAHRFDSATGDRLND